MFLVVEEFFIVTFRRRPASGRRAGATGVNAGHRDVVGHRSTSTYQEQICKPILR